MESPKVILFVVLGLVTAWFVVAWGRLFRKTSAADEPLETQHTSFHAAIAFICTFFDVLGIGNFAPTTSAFKFRGSVPDEKIPGTLNVGYAIPTIASAYIYIFVVKVEVDSTTLVSMIETGAPPSGVMEKGRSAMWKDRPPVTRSKRSVAAEGVTRRPVPVASKRMCWWFQRIGFAGLVAWAAGLNSNKRARRRIIGPEPYQKSPRPSSWPDARDGPDPASTGVAAGVKGSGLALDRVYTAEVEVGPIEALGLKSK